VRHRISFATTVVIASGPSLRQSDVDAVRGKAAVIAVNDNYRLAPWADVLYAADPDWWLKEPDFAGERWSTQPKSAGQDAWPEGDAKRLGVNLIDSIRAVGLSFEPGLIHQGGNSGYQAINLAVLMGARRVILLGFDLQISGGKIHHHADHAGKNPDSVALKEWAKAFETIECPPWLEIINCSRESALTCFPRMTIEECLLSVIAA